jgi:hypothetical protein
MRGILLAIVMALPLLACSAVGPFEYHEVDDIKEGSGVFTGEDGEWVIYGD